MDGRKLMLNILKPDLPRVRPSTTTTCIFEYVNANAENSKAYDTHVHESQQEEYQGFAEPSTRGKKISTIIRDGRSKIHGNFKKIF